MKNHLLATILLLSAALLPARAIADISGAPATTSSRDEADVETDERKIHRLLELFRTAELSLNQAMTTAEKLHGGSRTVQVNFEVSDPPAYRVRTARNNDVWENVIDAKTGSIAGQEIVSSLGTLDKSDRDNIIALQSVQQNLSDAVVVGERAASGKALGGGLLNQDGKMNFVVVVLSGDSLKQVMLEPPRIGRQGSARGNRANRAQGD